MLDHQHVLTLARKGDAQAIAYLINQALSARGVRVRAVCKEQCLHVLLESEQVPDRQLYARVVYAAVLCLGVPTIQTLQLYGRQQDANQPAWVQAFKLAALEPKAQSSTSEPVYAAQFTKAVEDQLPEITSETSIRTTASPAGKTSVKPSNVLKQRESRFNLPLPQMSFPVAVSICAASLGFGAGLTYLNHGEDEATNLATPNPPEQTTAQEVQNPALATFLPPPVDPSVNPSANPSANPSVAPSASPSAAASPVPSASPGVATSPQTAPASDPASEVALTIKAVGDMIPGNNSSGKVLPNTVGEQLDAEREFLFGNIKPFFDEADILFGNFESTLTDYPHSAKDTSQNMTFAFRTPPVYAQMLKDLGFDVLSVANNHSMDFGEQGFADTIANIQQLGMKAVGKQGEIVYTTVNGVSVAFIGFSYLPYHNSMHDLATASALVQEAKKQAKIVVISVHAGAEGSDQTHVADRNEYFFGENRGNLVTFSRTLIDQGADLILGHGPHVPRAVELYQGKLIAYSLGNFVGYQSLSTVGTLGYSLILKAQLNNEGDFVGGRIIPVALDKNGIPKLDDYFQSVVLIRNLTRQDFPQTPITIDDMGYILRTSN